MVYEVSLSIARLVRKYGRSISLIEWDHVIGILMIIFEFIEVSDVHQVEVVLKYNCYTLAYQR